MAVNDYVAVKDGYVDGEVKVAGTAFSTEFKGPKRDSKGAIVKDKDGNTTMVAIDDPSWVRRVGKADSVAIDAATNLTPNDVNLDAMSASELTAYAASINVDVTALTKKEDMLTAIKAARPAAI